MGMEIEAKFKLTDHRAIRVRLQAVGAQRVGRVLESNYIFDTQDRSLLASGRGLRVRVCTDCEPDPVPATVTYKGPAQLGAFKTREEIETRVDDPQALMDILQSLGFVQAIRFEKRRETWRWRDLTIELDKVPFLGCFVEIEGADDTVIREAQQQLGLAAEPSIRSSYIALLVEYCRAYSIPINEITFV